MSITAPAGGTTFDEGEAIFFVGTATDIEDGNLVLSWTADGTIDPSHIAFKFKGEDKFGNAMDPKADEFTGFSRVV